MNIICSVIESSSSTNSNSTSISGNNNDISNIINHYYQDTKQIHHQYHNAPFKNLHYSNIHDQHHDNNSIQ